MKINQPTLVKRYNDALEAVCNKRIDLTEFHIDAAGFSPEVAKLLGDDYLDTHHANQSFILISTKQIKLPLLDPSFTSYGAILRQFIKDNMKAISTLTALDSIYGELDNHMYKIKDFEQLIHIDHVDIKIDTPKKLISQKHNMDKLITKLMDERNEEAFLDNELLQGIADFASNIGDVRNNQMLPEVTRYPLDSFYTKHFGGIYILRNKLDTCSDKDLTAIYLDGNKPNYRGSKRVKYVDGRCKDEVFNFLKENKLIELMNESQLAIRVESLESKMRVVLADFLYSNNLLPEVCVANLNNQEVKAIIMDHYDQLPKEFTVIEELVRSIKNNMFTQKNMIFDFDIYCFKIVSDTDVQPYMPLLNHLMVRYMPHSLLRKFIYNHALFMKDFEQFNERKQEYVKAYLCARLHILDEMNF